MTLCSTRLKTDSVFLLHNSFSQVAYGWLIVPLLTNCSKPLSLTHSLTGSHSQFYHGLCLQNLYSCSSLLAPTITFLLLLHSQSCCDCIHIEMLLQKEFFPCLMLLPITCICQVAEPQGEAGALCCCLQGLGIVWSWNAAPEQWAIPKGREWHFKPLFKVSFGQLHSCVTSHWEFRNFFISVLMLSNDVLRIHDLPYLGCSLCTKSHHTLLKIPP